jgi:hypothetical protein
MGDLKDNPATISVNHLSQIPKPSNQFVFVDPQLSRSSLPIWPHIGVTGDDQTHRPLHKTVDQL